MFPATNYLKGHFYNRTCTDTRTVCGYYSVDSTASVEKVLCYSWGLSGLRQSREGLGLGLASTALMEKTRLEGH